MVRRQAGGVPQPWLAGGRSECPRPASRVAQTVPASRGDSAAPGLRNVAAEFEEADARADALSGNCQTVRRLGRPALALAHVRRSGPSGEARRGDFEALSKRNHLECGAATRDSSRDRAPPRSARQSVELLASASPYERAYPEAVYLRGLAYLGMHRGAEAAARVPKIVDHKGANWGSAWHHPYWGQCYSLSYLGLARGLRPCGRHGESEKSVPRLLRTLERRRPRHPHPETSQSRIREAAVSGLSPRKLPSARYNWIRTGKRRLDRRYPPERLILESLP